MKSRFQPLRKTRKRRPASDTQPQTCIQINSQCSQPDPQIQQSNSQLSKTLSTCYNPKQLRCRQQQKSTITKFIKNCLMSCGQQGSRVLYISGVPGVGKTVSIMQVINKIKKTISYKKATFKYINAMSLLMPSHLYTAINKQLYNPQKNDLKGNPPLKLMLKLQQDNRIKIIVIDQVDYLYTRNQNVLYNLFQWCNSPDTKLCTIVVANTMDFPQKLQSKITSRMGTNRLVFKPYNQKQVRLIIEERLMKSNRFSKQAVEYACKKMSSFTSDVRKLLDVLRRALQYKTSGQITIDDMFQTWKIFSQETGDVWQQNLPQFYRILMNTVKDHGGVSNNYKIYQRICAKKKYHMGQIMLAIKEMEQMGLFKIKPKRKGALNILQVTLLKI